MWVVIRRSQLFQCPGAGVRPVVDGLGGRPQRPICGQVPSAQEVIGAQCECVGQAPGLGVAVDYELHQSQALAGNGRASSRSRRYYRGAQARGGWRLVHVQRSGFDVADRWVDDGQAGIEQRAAEAREPSDQLARLSAPARSEDGPVEATVYLGRDFLGD